MKQIITFQFAENEKTLSMSIDNTDRTWINALQEFASFMSAAYGYDITSKIGISDSCFNETLDNPTYEPLGSF